jgi:hypothetical protein
MQGLFKLEVVPSCVVYDGQDEMIALLKEASNDLDGNV